jgi:hypothetical protein
MPVTIASLMVVASTYCSALDYSVHAQSSSQYLLYLAPRPNSVALCHHRGSWIGDL